MLRQSSMTLLGVLVPALGVALGSESRDLAAQVRTLALSPVTLPRALENPTPVKALFDSLLEARVVEAGYAIVPPARFDSLWARFRDSVGGYFDPYTGKLVDSLFEAVHHRTIRELHERYRADAWLAASISVTSVPFGGGTVHWFGAEEDGGGRGGLTGILLGRSEGTIPALTLVVTVWSLEGKKLLRGMGGIQLSEKLVGGDFRPVPRDSLFVDLARNSAAVHRATDSLSVGLEQVSKP